MGYPTSTTRPGAAEPLRDQHLGRARSGKRIGDTGNYTTEVTYDAQDRPITVVVASLTIRGVFAHT